MDAGNLRQRGAARERQPRDRERAGGPAHRGVPDRRADETEKLRRGARAIRADAERAPCRPRGAPGHRTGARRGEDLDTDGGRARGATVDGRAPVPISPGDVYARRVSERPDLFPARIEHHAAPVLRGPAVWRAPVERSLAAQAARRNPEADELEQLPLLYRTGAGQVAGYRR